MPRNASGTYTLPTGNPVVSGTLIEADWANTTLNDLANEITDSLSRSGEGGMLAPFRLADGLQASPGIAWLNEPSTGFYREGSGEMWGVVGGAQILQYTATGVLVPTGKTLTANGGITATTLTTSGAATLASASVTGNLSVGGTLTLTGGLTLNGNVTVGDSSADTLTINSTITSNLIFTDNTYDIGASGATRPRNLYLAGDGVIGGTLGVSGVLTASGGVTGNLTGNVTGNVTGSISGGTVAGTTGTFSSNFTVGGTLGVTGATTLSSTLGVTGAITASGGVSGNVTGNLTGNVTGSISGGTVAGSTGSFSSNVTVGGTLGVTGVATLTANPVLSAGTANGVLYLNGSKEATSGSAITYDGTTFKVDGAAVFNDSGADVDFRIESDTNANAFFVQGSDGFVGLGTDSPLDELHLTADNPAIRLEDTTNNAFARVECIDGNLYLGADRGDSAADSFMRFTVDNSEKMRIASDGSVGIGTSSPSTLLDVAGTVTADGLTVDGDGTLQTSDGAILTLKSTDTTVTAGDIYGSLQFESSDATNPGVVSKIEAEASGGNGGSILRFYTNDNTSTLERMSISYNGDISFYEDTGTTAKFFWDASEETLYLGATSGANTGEKLFVDGDVVLTTGNHILFGDSDALIRGYQSGQLEYFANTQLFKSSSGTERMRIDTSGNVGIGTSSPASKLHVSGTGTYIATFNNSSDDVRIELQRGGTQYGQISASTTSLNLVGSQSNTAIKFLVNGGTVTAATIDSSGNVGIGTSSPDTLLHLSDATGGAVIRLERDDTSIATADVYGSIEFEGQDASSGASGVRGSISGIAESSTGGMGLVFSTAASGSSNTERARISRDGELLVGTTSVLGASSAGSTHIVGGSNSVSQVPLYLRNPYSTAGRYWKTGPTNNAGYIVYNDSDTGLYVSYGGTSWVANSDESLKENISDVGSVINKLKNYRCINYSLKSSKSDAADKIGFIAQDWENDFPNTVSKADDGTLGIKYTETIPVLLKAIQEQQAMIEDLKAKVAALEGAK